MRYLCRGDANSELQTTEIILGQERRKDSNSRNIPKETKRFLQVFNADRPVTFQIYGDRDELKRVTSDGKLLDPNARLFHGKFDVHVNTPLRLNSRGAGVHVMVNEGNGKGRITAHVERVRGVFTDYDGTRLPASFFLEPHRHE